jgi:pimeloyl-ACP methyl ester carboxylesterase
MALPIRRTTLLAAVLATALLASCSSDDPGAEADADTGSDDTTTTATGEGAEVEAFTGSLDDFYVVPDPLPEGEPGELIRTMAVSEGDGATTVRVMYHSRDAQDRDRAVTGTITHPDGPAPEGGWPVISTAHGTTGIAPVCAPSRGDGAAPGYGIEGVHVATDYIGLGPVGELHPYLSRLSEGRSVIDMVRAARNLPDTGAGERWIAIGGSQGGHGAMAAAELAADHAPELELLGTVALAPGAVFDQTYGAIDAVVVEVITAIALYGAPSDHPDIDPADYFTPAALAAASEVMETACLGDITSAMLPVRPLFANDPATTEPFASAMTANDVGFVDVDAPLFLTSGTADTTVVIDRVRDLFDRLCETGQQTELLVVEGADHGTIGNQAAEQVTAFMQDRIDGAEADDSCEAG